MEMVLMNPAEFYKSDTSLSIDLSFSKPLILDIVGFVPPGRQG